jgi:hypothetical protein
MTINTKEPCDGCGEDLWRFDGEPRTCDNCNAAATKAANIAAAEPEPQPVDASGNLIPPPADPVFPEGYTPEPTAAPEA